MGAIRLPPRPAGRARAASGAPPRPGRGVGGPRHVGGGETQRGRRAAPRGEGSRGRRRRGGGEAAGRARADARRRRSRRGRIRFRSPGRGAGHRQGRARLGRREARTAPEPGADHRPAPGRRGRRLRARQAPERQPLRGVGAVRGAGGVDRRRQRADRRPHRRGLLAGARRPPYRSRRPPQRRRTAPRQEPLRRGDLPRLAGAGAVTGRAPLQPVREGGSTPRRHLPRRGVRQPRCRDAGDGRGRGLRARFAGPHGGSRHPREGPGRADAGPLRGQIRAWRQHGREGGGMRFAVAQWAPEYGTPAELDETTGRVEVGVEVPPGEWRGLVPDVEPVDDVLFIDGVRRVDANLWIEQPQGRPVLGLAATYAAGAVRSNGTAEIVATRVERGLFTSAAATDIVTTCGVYSVKATSGQTPEELWLGIQQRMGELEGAVAADQEGATLVIADGPLSHHRHAEGEVGQLVGYVKREHVEYLPSEL